MEYICYVGNERDSDSEDSDSELLDAEETTSRYMHSCM